jgi:hypothetical protein
MYRNIDEDVKLLKFAKRYHSEDSLTIDQLKYIAKQDGYSEREIELAINDYYWIYIHSKTVAERVFFIFSIIAFILIIVGHIIRHIH